MLDLLNFLLFNFLSGSKPAVGVVRKYKKKLRKILGKSTGWGVDLKDVAFLLNLF